MKVVFYAAAPGRFDAVLSEAMRKGVKRAGDKIRIVPIESYPERGPEADVAVLVGVKGHSKACFEGHVAAGKHAVVIDKGYTRLAGGPLGTLYLRTSVDAFQPHAYLLSREMPPDRWERLGVAVRPCVPKSEGRVLFCGSSQKYCDWHGLGDATAYAENILTKIRGRTGREIAYRPKPTWKDAKPIDGFAYSPGVLRFSNELETTFLVATFGSNAAFEAILAGVPALVVGDGIARPLARTRLRDVEAPYYPTSDEVDRLARAVAYCQWTVAEMESGEAWQHLRTVVEDLDARK